MEYGLDSTLSSVQVSDYLKNGVLNPEMANFPDELVNHAKENKKPQESVNVNGEGGQDISDIQEDPFENSYSSESDALVIDESVPKKKKVKGKCTKKPKEDVKFSTEKDSDELFSVDDKQDKVISEKSNLTENHNTQLSELHNFPASVFSDNTQNSDTFSVNSDALDQRISESHMHCDISKLDSDINSNPELLSHSNPFFHESLFELTQLHHTNSENPCDRFQNATVDGTDISSTVKRTLKRTKPKPKLKEYAQYLGLQPAVQFRCQKCGKSGFESLLTLQEHFLHCNSVQLLETSSGNENISGFKLTRKVFLCSACGTYYENWNLYMHMLEYHKRYICLYCLGMFSVLNDLCQHIQSRHNLEPGVKNTLEDFFNAYNEPCYVVCCECSQQFNEGDNFFYHNCIIPKPPMKSKPKHIKQIIAPENHITGDSGTGSNKISESPVLDKSNSLDETDLITDGQKTYPVDDLEKQSTNISDTEESIHKAENLIQDNNSKQNHIDKEMSKNSDSDSSGSQDELDDLQKRTLNTEEYKNDDSVEAKSDRTFEDDNGGEIEERDEQVSLDSSKNFDGVVDQQPTENTMDSIEEDLSDSDVNAAVCDFPLEEPAETRKVPKLSLKLSKLESYPGPDQEDGYDSDKPDMEVDNIESENENDHALSEQEDLDQSEEHPHDEPVAEEEEPKSISSHYPVAGPDIPVVEIELDQPLDKMDIRVLLQKCLRATVSTCIYCNHSRRIAVNGKQLGLHALAEHRYSAINKSITEEELIPESFNNRIKECLEQLETVFFNLDSGASDEAVTFSHVFECFQCHFSTTVHKELYLHNRKFHSKNLLLCIMCKSNFYSYSELICHLCPGVYVLDYDVHFRCCMCVSDDLPSSFRLMVHLRKRHNVCDVCLEMCHSQYKLSNHVWKHKLHHFCYRCGIAYRNKPDITRHLFWKHGTESLLCKKCLQKKWPHVYHFCVPPTSFVCEECNLAFTRAVSLKVHKRLHTDEKKHACSWENCTESFISKKIMLKHLKRHTEPEEIKVNETIKIEEEKKDDGEENCETEETPESEEPLKAVKPKVDVYDLPELNLSESDSSDSDSESGKPKPEENSISQQSLENPNEHSQGETLTPVEGGAIDAATVEDHELPPNTEQLPVDDTTSSVMQDIWDNFKNYQANKEKMDNILIGDVETKVDQPYVPDIPIPEVEEGVTWQLALRDHDYCADPEKTKAPDTIIEVKPSLESTESMDHDYCFLTEKDKDNTAGPVSAVPPPPDIPSEVATKNSPARKRTSSSSSSSSDSDSSCACGSSCSCSNSSSASSSSSSDSSNSDSSTEEGRQRQQQRRQKRKERNKASKKTKPDQPEPETKVDVVTSDQLPMVEMPIQESDLETTESETDEEFYDREPQKFAKKILEEKRAQLLAEMGPNMVPNGSFIESTSRPPTPPAGTLEEEEQPKRKKKTKKRKKRKSEKRVSEEGRTYSAQLIVDPGLVAPPPSVPYYQQFHQTGNHSPNITPTTLSLAKNSPVRQPQTPPLFGLSSDTPLLARQESAASDTSIRSSKRRRVPNKFYGYSSDEEGDKLHSSKRSKTEINRTIPAPPSPKLVPPITIKTVSSPLAASPRPQTVEPITLRLPKPQTQTTDYKSYRRARPTIPPIRLSAPRPSIPLPREDSATDSNESDLEEPSPQPPQIITEVPKQPQPQLYCYCRCPYDEVSEMIGCDSSDCQIEWFHFECVGIMVPPKGQWFCPDCRKKKQQQRNLN